MAKKREKTSTTESVKVKAVKADKSAEKAAPMKKKAAPVKEVPADQSMLETLKDKAVGIFTKEKEPYEPSSEEIRIQAYFVAERRMAAGLPGNADSDWTQAEKELRS